MYVPISAEDLDRLRELARAELRRPQEQAVVLIREALAARRQAARGADSASGKPRDQGPVR